MLSIIIIKMLFSSDTPEIVSWVSFPGTHVEADLLARNLLVSALQDNAFEGVREARLNREGSCTTMK